MKVSLKIRNFLKTLKRDLKKVNVDQKQILKKDCLYQKRKKKEYSRNEEKRWNNLKRHVRCQRKATLGDKNLAEGIVQRWLVFISFI